MQIVQIAIIFLFPLLLIVLSKKHRWINTLSPILFCYALGIIWSNIRGIPLDRELSMTLTEVTVPIAIPMILLSTHLKQFVKNAKTIVLSFVLIVVSAMTSAVIAGLIFKDAVIEYAKVGGMLVGVYTGGTPNLMAIGMGLNVEAETMILVNAFDAVLGGLYFLVIITVLKPVLSKFLRPYQKVDMTIEQTDTEPEFSSLSKKEKKKSIFSLTGALGYCVLALGLSIGLSLLITQSLNTALIMLSVTTAGVVGSFLPMIKKIRYTYSLGQYLIYVFSVSLGSLVEIETMLKATPVILGYTAVAMFGALFIHFILAKITKIDVDTAIITSSAGIYGPPFIGPIADSLKNKDMIVPGLTCGLVGYAVGNYFGYIIYQVLLLL